MCCSFTASKRKMAESTGSIYKEVTLCSEASKAAVQCVKGREQNSAISTKIYPCTGALLYTLRHALAP